jgi:choline dehydrogenase-like flavoprotein
MLIDGIDGLGGVRRPLVVVGSGPVGLALATDIARRGMPVLLLESGGNASDPAVQALSDATLVEAARHDDMNVAVARRLGGSSNLWGGRCVPYDPIDFEDRPFVKARWPIGYKDVAPFIGRAMEATRAGAPVFEANTPLAPGADGSFSVDALERWVNIQAAQIVHRRAIAEDPLLEVRTRATAVGIHFHEDGRVESLDVAHSLSGERVRIPVDRLVIAGGGLETTRLLLAAQRKAPQRFGGPDGPLGRYYMGHVIGEIADIVFASGATARAFDFEIDAHGSYVRRRIVPSAETQRRHGLLNSAFWPVVPPVADPRHSSATLSLVYLALSYRPLGRRIVAEAIRRRHLSERPTRLLPHLVNLATGIPSALAFSATFLRRRYGGTFRLPGFFVLNPANRYGLSFHSEHAPDPDSRVRLSGEVDRLGMPSLVIDLRFGESDINSLIATHDLLEHWLERSGIGRIEYRVPREERAAAIIDQASHGTHQIGLARMATMAREGIVDGDLRCFGAPNLFIASSAVLPTSSQANPTLTTVALALRLADMLIADRPTVVDTAPVAGGGA